MRGSIYWGHTEQARTALDLRYSSLVCHKLHWNVVFHVPLYFASMAISVRLVSSRFVSYFLLTMTRETDTIFLSDYWAAHEHKVKGRMPSGMWQVPCGKWQVVSGTLKCYELNAILAWASVTATLLHSCLIHLQHLTRSSLGDKQKFNIIWIFVPNFICFPWTVLHCFNCCVFIVGLKILFLEFHQKNFNGFRRIFF